MSPFREKLRAQRAALPRVPRKNDYDAVLLRVVAFEEPPVAFQALWDGEGVVSHLALEVS